MKGGIYGTPRKRNFEVGEAWCAFCDVVFGFLGNHKDTNYKQPVAKFIENFKKLSCRMSLKVYFIFYILT